MASTERPAAALGSFLKSLREARAFTLRYVESKTGISNAFLSQVESGKVRQPSPVMLYKLADLYEVPYEELMGRAGYPVSSSHPQETRSAPAVFRRLGNITEEEEQELLEYLAFLRSRTKREGHKR